MCAGRDPEARRIATVRESDDQEQATMIARVSCSRAPLVARLRHEICHEPAPDICTVARGRQPEDDRIASARWVPAVG